MSFVAVSHKFTYILKKTRKKHQMTFCDIHINIIIYIERLFAPWMFTYQIIIVLETSTMLTVDKNEQTLVERLNKLFAGYYHADCTANHKYVPLRCLFYIYRYNGPQ